MRSTSMRPCLVPAFLFVTLPLLLLAPLAGCGRQSSEPQLSEEQRRARGAEIVAAYRQRDGAPNRHLRLRMTSSLSSGPPDVYEFEVWRKQSQDETLTLMHVVSPQSERDLASLSIERRGRPSENVSYRRTTNEFQDFDSEQRAFGGLTVLELLGEWNRYDARLIGERDVDGVRMYEVENTLKPNEDSQIKRFVTLFRADTMLPAEAHLFDARDRELRTYRISEYRTIEGRPTIWRVEIQNHSRNSRIDIEMLDVNYGEELNRNLFTRENLRRVTAS